MTANIAIAVLILLAIAALAIARNNRQQQNRSSSTTSRRQKGRAGWSPGTKKRHDPTYDDEDEVDRRLRELRAFQRYEKVREAAEEVAKHGPQPATPVVEPIGALITKEVIKLRHEESHYQENIDRAETSRVVGEARDLISDLNLQFGWIPGEPSIADRMFNTDVETVLGAAISKGKIDFRTRAMVATMRSYARASTGGRNELAEVMATRNLLGTGRLVANESEDLDRARTLFGDEYAEAAGFVDHLTRSQELVDAKRLGLNSPQEHAADRSLDDSGGWGGRGINRA